MSDASLTSGGTTAAMGNARIGQAADCQRAVTAINASVACCSSSACWLTDAPGSVVVNDAERTTEDAIEDMLSAGHIVENFEKSNDGAGYTEELEGRNAEPATVEFGAGETTILHDAAVFEGAIEEPVAVDQDALAATEGFTSEFHGFPPTGVEISDALWLNESIPSIEGKKK